MKINFSVLLLSIPCNFRLSGVLNNLYGLTGMLNVDEDVALVDNSLKMLQKQSVLQTQNVRFVPAFLLSNARTAFSYLNASPAFFSNARSMSNVRPAF